jgi:putative ABC transport system permease protein
VRALDPDLPLQSVMTLDAELTRDRWEAHFLSVAFGIFAGIALVLATVGVYAVTAYAVVLRTREIGIRVALGARGRQVLWLLTRQASMRLLIGLLIGMPGAWAVGRILEGGLEGVSASDPLTFTGVPVLLALAVLTSSLIPTARAARLNPAAALRSE